MSDPIESDYESWMAGEEPEAPPRLQVVQPFPAEATFEGATRVSWSLRRLRRELAGWDVKAADERLRLDEWYTARTKAIRADIEDKMRQLEGIARSLHDADTATKSWALPSEITLRLTATRPAATVVDEAAAVAWLETNGLGGLVRHTAALAVDQAKREAAVVWRPLACSALIAAPGPVPDEFPITGKEADGRLAVVRSEGDGRVFVEGEVANLDPGSYPLAPIAGDDGRLVGVAVVARKTANSVGFLNVAHVDTRIADLVVQVPVVDDDGAATGEIVGRAIPGVVLERAVEPRFSLQ